MPTNPSTPVYPAKLKIPKVNSYSITDFNTFEKCPFKFFVCKYLDKKYELEEGSEQMAVGAILDEAIKKYHLAKAYDLTKSELANFIMAAVAYIKEKAAKQNSKYSYYGGLLPYIKPEVVQKAIQIFENYFDCRGAKINPSIGPVPFAEYPLKIEEKDFQLWGWPDAYEIGEDGVIEVVDYKSREDVDKGKENMDMKLMPKIYVLLASKDLLSKGYKKARFVVRFWQDPKEDGFCEEFDLEKVVEFENLFISLIKKILETKEILFCEKPYCKACKSERREEFLIELEKSGLMPIVTTAVLSNKIGGQQVV